MEPCIAVRETMPVQITVLRGTNLKGSKAESLLNVRVEFNTAVLGDSPKLEQSAEQGVEFNFTCRFDCSEGLNTLDDLAHKPVILTLVEILPKEKKQKEEKTITLGQAVVDLLPLLQGQHTFTTTVTLHPAPGSPTETSTTEGSKVNVLCPSQSILEVAVSVPDALLSDAQLADSNLFRVSVETAYSVPEVWSTTGPQFSYMACLQVPVSLEKEQLLFFPSGVLKTGGEREPVPRPKKWTSGLILAPGAQYIPASFIEEGPAEGEDGELSGPEYREFRAEAESTKKRVSWDTERRFFMDPASQACLVKRISDCRYWPVEFMRAPLATTTKGKAAKGDEDVQISFHGVAYVDMAPLLYPGVKRIRGAYHILPFSEIDLYTKTKRQGSILKEYLRQASQTGRGTAPTAIGSSQFRGAPGKISKDDKGPKDNAKKLSIQPLVQKPQGSDSVVEFETIAPPNPEGQMYAEAGSYIVIEVALDKPLVRKRPPEELTKRVAELIPPRPAIPRRTAGAEKAVKDFHGQVASVAGLVLEQYQELFGGALAQGELPLDPSAQEERKAKLLGELNYSGKYFAFKEQLKHSVVRIVREKLLKTTTFPSQEELQAFLSQLYIFLVDQMHISLNKTLSVDVPETETQPFTDCAQLKHFAREAEVNEDYELAAMYYQERLARDRSNPDHWFDYGAFCLLISDHAKAEDCFHHAVAIDQRHLHSLLLCGVLAEMRGCFADAETFFESGTCVEPSSVLAWTMLGLYSEAQGNEIRAEMAFLEAAKWMKAEAGEGSVTQAVGEPLPSEGKSTQLQEGATVSEEGVPVTEREERDVEVEAESVVSEAEQTAAVSQPEPAVLKPCENAPGHNNTIYMEAAKFLLQANALQFAQRALAQDLLSPEGGTSCSYYLALARLHLQRRDFDSADQNLQEALHVNQENPDVWALIGHLHYMRRDFHEARECYRRNLDFVTDASEMHPVYLRLGTIYLQEDQFEKAKLTFLRACKNSPSCLSWLGLGTACYRLGELTEAEDALAEANILNNRNPEVWGYLSLVCLQTGRQLEAEQSYKYAVKLKLKSEALLQEIHALQQRVGFGNPAF
ncbi:cilia- and flagella-associated protein 70 isoform X1 [Acipenser ruthenus]|uniref:cilia- and flagella-associated protein 70 isoform X1 n=1 Tax=Acipenser ruthenus TaxID=7906 RepID=UPI00274112D0|nr:cilia- and flagella-associated protein 70 isoform X1 [Acipenser ruthenus]